MSPSRKSSAKKSTSKTTSGKRTRKGTSSKAKKTTARSSGRKAAAKTSARKAPKKAASKKAASKKAEPKKVESKKAPAARRTAGKTKERPAAPPAEARKAPAPSAPRTPRRRSSRSRQAKQAALQQHAVAGAKPGLGLKWVCFSCGAKFYDLGRSEPICPRCSTDQRQRPKEAAEAPSPPTRRPAAAPMSRLLDDDEAQAEEFDEDLDDEAAELDIESLEETTGFSDSSGDED